MKAHEIIGLRFSRLVILKKLNKAKVEVLCDCGTIKITYWDSIRCGETKSCGCLKKERYPFLKRSHGLSRTTEYTTWAAMKSRCTYKGYHGYKNYGGRGITYDPRWEKFENFFEDMGPRPSKDHSLDRIDNDKNYGPENCRWAERKTQMLNQRRTLFTYVDGQKISLKEYSKISGISYPTLVHRHKKNQKIDKPIKK